MSDSGLFSSFYAILCATRNNEWRGTSVLSNAPILPRAVDKTIHKGLILGDGHYQCSETRCLPRNLPPLECGVLLCTKDRTVQAAPGE